MSTFASILSRFVMCVLACAAPPVHALAHEMWIDPETFVLGADDTLEAELRVGENYAGGGFPYLPNRTERLEVYTGQNAGSPIAGRAGDRPAVQLNMTSEGLHVLAYESDVSTVRYQEFEKFQAFVEHKDFSDALERHTARGLSTEDFTETYSRHAKSLVAIGSGAGADVEIGMITEIIALDNPYTDGLEDGLRVRVEYLDEPRANAQVEIFSRPSGEGNASENVVVTTARTDVDGIAIIPVERGRDYMLDAVVLRAPPEDRAAMREAVWDSLWANLTFSVPTARLQ